MPILLVIVCIMLAAASGVLAVYWGAVAWHIGRAVRRVPTCRDGLKLPRAEELKKPTAPRVCVIVPAHNEAGVVGKLAASLMKQTYPRAQLRVVFALDRCTDSTAAEIRHETAGSDHVEIVEVSACPPDWAGKVHATWRGVQSSRAAREAEILVFTDADTEFDAECVRAAAALLLERDLGMLSLMSTLTAERGFEKVAQPAAGIELMRQYPLVRANARRHRRAFANGQFMMFTRETYEKLGGHEAVKDAVLEDIELARLAERRGVPAGLFLADRMLRCRMYGTWDEFVRGWKRIYIEAANRRVKRLRQSAVRLWATGLGPPACACGTAAVQVSGGAGGPLGNVAAALAALAMLAMLLATGWAYRISRVPVLWALLYPVGALRMGMILSDAARDLKSGVPVRWGGREYVREAR